MGIMDKNVVNEAVKNMNLALKLDRKIVGVKFLFDEDEFKKADVKKLTGKMAYCVMIRTAMTGKAMKAAVDNFGCMGAARALSVVEPDEMSLSGRYYQRLGLYQDLATSKNVQRNMTFCRHKAYGIMVKPVEKYDEEPDVVLIVTNPYNGMRIIQAYTHVFGFNIAYKMSGNQAICSECTAFPFESNNINVSLLCAGTRFKAKWGDEEMAIGFPFNQFLSIVRGLYATLDLIEPNEKKAEIEVRFGEAGRTPPTIHYNKNYYTGLNPE
jgi:uncharacterized protein (DUF169 family)